MNAYKFLPVIIAAAALAGCGEKPPATSAATPPAAVTPATPAPAAPAPTVVAAAPAAAPAASAADLATGEKIYTATCVACHGAGVLGAPKFGDKAAWQPRIAKGMDALYASSMNGFKMMPPRGGNAGLKDPDLKAAVDYMVSKAN